MESMGEVFLLALYLLPLLLLLTAAAFLVDKLPEKWIERLERWWRI